MIYNLFTRPKSSRGFSLLELQVSLVIFGLALSGVVPLASMQLKQVKKVDALLEPDSTYYLVPSTDSWEQRLGAAATLANSAPVTSSYPTLGYINFQVATTSPGSFGGKTYRADYGQTFGDRGGGYWYGWNAANTANMRNRNLGNSPDERYDTLANMQLDGTFKWEVAVPNGVYRVWLVAGDPGFADSIYSINVEGNLTVFAIATVGKKWVEGSTTVAVRDGRLTVSNGLLAINNKICCLYYEEAQPLTVVEVLQINKSLTTDETVVKISLLGL